MSERIARAWNDFFFTGFSVQSLGLLRFWFCAGLLVLHATQFYSFYEISPSGPGFVFLDPMWPFQLLGVESHVPAVTHAVLIGLVIFTVTAALGFRTRTSLVLLMLSILYLKGVRDSISGDVHHRYVMPFHILGLLAMSRCGYAYSLDERIRRARGVAAERIEEWRASWPIKTAQLYVCTFYFFSIIAKFRVTGWEWFADGQRIQALLLKRSIMWGAGEGGHAVDNVVGYWIAHQPALCFFLGIMTLVMEAGFPLILLMSPRWRLFVLSGVVVFHVANLLLAYVGFVLIPIVFLVFFDLTVAARAIREWLARRRPASAAVPG